MHISVDTFVQVVIEKGQPLIANPKASIGKIIGDKFKRKWRWSAKAKLVFAEPKAKTDWTSYLIGTVWDGRL